MRRIALALLLALGICVGAAEPAHAWDAFMIPEPGAADGWVITSSWSTMVPMADYEYKDYVFDADGRVQSVVSSESGVGGGIKEGPTTYTYDDQGRVTSETDSTGKLTYVYDPDGSRTEYRDGQKSGWVSFPDGAWTPFKNHYGYRGMTNDSYGNWSLEVENGQLARATCSNEVGSETITYSYEFDGQGRPLKVHSDIATTGEYLASPPSELVYTYEPDGGYSCQETNAQGYCLYVFNAKGQLTHFEQKTDDGYEKIDFARDYEYDEHGNNVRIVDPNATGEVMGRPMGVREYTYMQVQKQKVVDVPVSDDPAVDFVYRLYNPWTHEHLYTTDRGEANGLQPQGWTYEQVEWRAPKASGSPIYRLYNPWTHEHLYTTERGEYDGLVSQGWTGEGEKLLSAGEGGVPVYRLYNPWETGPGSHHYTTDASERDSLAGRGWTYEKVAFYGVR